MEPADWSRYAALCHVHAERIRQTELWGDQWKPNSIHPFEKAAILTEEFLEVIRELNDNRGNETVELHAELVQLAAVVVAWLESMTTEEVEIPGG